jgi:hygromycin-B 4-O-kinase
MLNKLTLQPSAVADFLRARLGNIDPRTIQPVGHGEWSTAFYVQHADEYRDLVVRFSATDDDFRKDQRALRYASRRLPLANLLEIGEAFGGFYAISERAFGEFIEHRDAAAMQRLLPSLFDVLDAVRTVDISDTLGFGLWHADGSAPYATWQAFLHAVSTDPPSSRTHGWRQRLEQLPAAYAMFERGFSAMERLIPLCPNARHLVHSDLLYFNVLVTNDQISCVLDWGASIYGDFLWDLAWFTFWQPWYTPWASVDIRGAALRHFSDIGLDVPKFEERMRCYELAIGLDGMAYQAFAGHTDNLAWTTRRVSGLIDA